MSTVGWSWSRTAAWRAIALGAAALGASLLTGDPASAATEAPRKMPEVGHVHTLLVNPTGGNLLLGTHRGLYLSRDEGRSWQRAEVAGTIPGTDFMTLAADLRDPRILYAGGHDLGVVKSVDEGKSWAPTGPGLESGHVHALAVAPNVPSTLHAWVDQDGLYRTPDGGGRWTRVDDGPMNPNVRALAQPDIPTGMGGVFVYAATSDGVFRSADCF